MSNRISYNSIPQNGLVLDMPLNGNANARVGSNGTATNLVYLDSEKGYTSKVGSFNGSSSYISTSHTQYNNNTFTVSAYFKVNTWITGGGILGFFNGTTYKGNTLYTSGTTGQLTRLANGVNTTFTPAFNIYNYNHYIIENTATQSKLYVNGILQYTINATYATNDNNLFTIGRIYPNLSQNYGAATIGLVKIYNRALSTEEIHNLKLEGDRLFGDKPNYPQLLRGLKAYYDFKGGSLSNLVDGTNATNNGATLTTDHLGRANNAYSFNGSSSYINLGNSLSYQVKGVNTKLQLYIKFKWTNSTAGALIGKYLNFYGGSEYTVAITNTGELSVIGNGNNSATSTGLGLQLNTIYDMYFSMIGNGTFTIFINGVSVFSGSVLINSSGGTENLLLGARSLSTYPGYFGGIIYNFMCFNYPTNNASEVKELYNLTSKEYIYPFSKSSLLALEKGLVMHLDSNGNDLSGNGNNGTPTAVTATRRGQSEGGIYNGSTSNFNIPNGIINTQADFTLGSIIKPNVWSNSNSVIRLYDNSDIGFMYYQPNGGMIFHLWSGVLNYVVIPTSLIPVGGVYNIVCVRSKVYGMSIYLDGKLIQHNTFTGNSILTTAQSNVGTVYTNGTEHFNGNIYSPKIWNRALTPKEVEMEYYLNYIN